MEGRRDAIQETILIPNWERTSANHRSAES
jgi:hypothetical protein